MDVYKDDEFPIVQISRRKFDALCYVRLPYIGYLFEEIDWFQAFDFKLISTIVIDGDKEYCFVILGRDKRRVFRVVAVPDQVFDSYDDAADAMILALLRFRDDGKEWYEQGDEKDLPNEFLIPQVSEDKLHPSFKLLEARGHEGARNLINEIVYTFVDVDGNYIKDFQSTGFDRRLWELYLYVYFYHARFSFDHSYNSPDFLLSYFGQELAVEAVTVNRGDVMQEENPAMAGNAFLLSLDYMPIKFAGPLTSKLKKRYWLQDHVKGKAFVIAIHDFHQEATKETLGSMTWSRNALVYYLYGIKPKFGFPDKEHVRPQYKITESGMSFDYEKVSEFHWREKRIEGGFFDLPDSENVSAVLFTNNATITAFNRMGQLAGLGAATTRMTRIMDIYNPEPGTIQPIRKVMDITSDEYEEAWGDSMVMYHNPNALIPVDISCFQDISHMFFDSAKLTVSGYPIPYEVLNSMTMVFVPASDKSKSNDED